MNNKLKMQIRDILENHRIPKTMPGTNVVVYEPFVSANSFDEICSQIEDAIKQQECKHCGAKLVEISLNKTK